MTPEIALVLAVLVVTVVLFVTEALRVDIVAIAVMVALPWLGLIEPEAAFSGLAGNAVVAIVAVMILSHGLDRSGVITRIIRPMLRVAGNGERRITGILSGLAALISAIMQNIGAAALLLPAALRISKRTDIPASRLLMPMGFVAILGGTLTLVASGPLIILNDLLRQSGEAPYGLFSVTPIGLALVGAGIAYFLVFGRSVLPRQTGDTDEAADDGKRDLADVWDLPRSTHRCVIPSGSTLAEHTRESANIWSEYGLHLLAIRQASETTFAPWRFTPFAVEQELHLLGQQADFDRFTKRFKLESVESGTGAIEAMESACFGELLVPPRSPVRGRSMRELALRNTYGVEPILLLRGDHVFRSDFSDEPLTVGDALVVYGPGKHLEQMGDRRHFALTTSVDEERPTRSTKPVVATLCALAAVGLALSGAHLAVSLFTGAIAMILLRVVPIDDAYKAVDWRTVFLLAGLIPLGMAMEQTGGAKYLASALMQLPHGGSPVLILSGIAILATLFSLFMSNVAATVLLVPLVVVMGREANISPRALALLVGVAASNSFVLPTHQVNALLMSPGGYHNKDYLRAGGILTICFIVISVSLIYAFYI